MVPWDGICSDDIAGVFGPVIVYWAYAGLYFVLDCLDIPALQARRLHSKVDENRKNRVSLSQVVRGVLLQQTMQCAVAVGLFALDPMSQSQQKVPSFGRQVVQFGVAMFVLDTWQYFMHRLMHESVYLYRKLHSWHHRLIVPYAIGALYNHPLEGLIMDTVGGALAFLASGMHPQTAVWFFCFATMKTVDDHCGLALPLHPFQFLFPNNAAYHDVHHQLAGFKYNYSQPFFSIWDFVLGTHMPFQVIKRVEGGLEVHPLKSSSVKS